MKKKYGPYGVHLLRSYKSWSDMKQRCTNPKHSAYRYYGGRGIKVCPEWSASFKQFLADMGEPQPGYSLDRINNNDDYRPGNCRWATHAEQVNNRRDTVFLNVDGENLTLTQASSKWGINRLAIRARLKYGWSDKDAVTLPVQIGTPYKLRKTTPGD